LSSVRKAWLPSRRRRIWFLHAWAIPLAIVALVSLSAFGDVIGRRAPLTHEDRNNYARAAAVLVEWRFGHFHPMILRDGFGGMGSGFPMFYPPLGLWVSALLSGLVGDCVLGTNLALFASVLLSGATFYALGRAVSRSRWLALLAAAVYLAAPYRFVDINVRGALAESWSFVWWPLLALGAWRIAQGRRMPIWLPFAAAGMALAHPAMALYAALLGVPFAVACVWRRRWPAAARLALAAGLGGALAAWSIVPQQAHFPAIKASNPEFMWTNIDFVASHRVSLRQLLHFDSDEWAVGVSGAPMSLEVGKAALGCWLAAGIALLLGRRPSRAQLAFGLAAFVAFAFCIAAMLAPRAVLSALPRQFAVIQFPWRLLGPAAFFSALALAALAAPLARLRRFREGALVALAAVVLAVPDEWKETNSASGEPASNFARPRLEEVYGKRGFAVLGEHLPREFPMHGVDPAEVFAFFDAYRPPPARAVAGDAKVSFREEPGGAFLLEGQAGVPSEVIVPLVHYPVRFAHSARGEPVALRNRDGLVAVEVPAGAFSIRFDYGPDKWHRIGLAISVAGLGALLALRRLAPRF